MGKIIMVTTTVATTTKTVIEMAGLVLRVEHCDILQRGAE
jgi:hypothetical protein